MRLNEGMKIYIDTSKSSGKDAFAELYIFIRNSHDKNRYKMHNDPIPPKLDPDGTRKQLKYIENGKTYYFW